MKKRDGFTGERAVVLPQAVREMQLRDPLTQSLYVTDIGYYPHADSHFRRRDEAIDQHVLIYCVRGKGWYEVGGKRQEVTENQFFFLPAGMPHAYGSQEECPWTIYWIHFGGHHADIYVQGDSAPHCVAPGMASRIANRNSIFEEIFAALQGGCRCATLRYVSSLLHYYLASMRYLQEYRHTQSGTAEPEVVKAVAHYMRENIGNKLTLKELAAYSGYSANHFSALFRHETGLAPIAYFNRMKVDYACSLLRSTAMKINQICFKVGIEDSYYFSRLFRLHTGCSPKAYRMRHAKTDEEAGAEAQTECLQ